MNDGSDGTYRIQSTGVRVRRVEARKTIERNAHALVVQTTDSRGRVPMVIREHFPDWWADLRRKQNTIYGSLLRFIDMSILAKTPKWMLQLIPAWIAEYIDNVHPGDHRVGERRCEYRRIA